MPRANPTAAIEARQRREKFMEEFNALQALETRQKLKVDWENKTEGKCKQQRLMRTLDVIEANHHNNVEARRRRLAALLLAEQQTHENMLSNLTETDSQRRERLIRKAQELREAREKEKKLDNQARNDRLFREKIDVLRQAESRLKAMQMAEARASQITYAHEQRARAQEEEELYFAQQAQEAQRKALERVQHDADVRYTRIQQNKADLQAQVRGNALRHVQEQEHQRQEREEFHRALHEEEVNALHHAAVQRQRQVKLGQEMKELNEELQRARKQEYELLQAEDKALMDKLLKELAEEELKIKENKMAHKAAMWNEFIEARQQLHQRREDNEAIDKLWEEANAAEWAKRERKWNAEQAARDALLRQVLIIRRQQVLEKRAEQQARAEEQQRGNENELQWLCSSNGDEAESRRRHWEQLRAYQRELDAQIAQRDAIRESEREKKRTELSLNKKEEEEYLARITHELSNLEAAKPDAFKHIPLLTQRDRQTIC